MLHNPHERVVIANARLEAAVSAQCRQNNRPARTRAESTMAGGGDGVAGVRQAQNGFRRPLVSPNPSRCLTPSSTPERTDPVLANCRVPGDPNRSGRETAKQSSRPTYKGEQK